MTEIQRRVRFMGWVDEIPSRAQKVAPASEYDVLRIVMMAENSQARKWVEFACEDNMHAVKVANYIKRLGFNIEVRARRDRLYARRR